VRRSGTLRLLVIMAFVVGGLGFEVTFGAALRPAYAHAELV
jgi:hypothetical protein